MIRPVETSVPSKINGVDIKPARVSPGAAVQRKTERTAGEAGSSAVSDTDVQITGAARGLAAIEQSLRELPAIDEARVADVRRRLDSGSYQIDPQKVADRLLHLEHELGRGNPLSDSDLK
jgi:negative regulator of flagellin synthesis FlgM